MSQWVRPLFFSRILDCALMPRRYFFSSTQSQVLTILQNPAVLKENLHKQGVYLPGKYLHDHFTWWLSQYARQFPLSLEAYFTNKIELNSLCQEFIQFCFKHHIFLNKEKTLKSFEYHDAVSDKALKQELALFSYKPKINILGFGLGTGHYEKNIAEYFIQNRLAESVKIYGFDPYAENSNEIEFLTATQLVTNQHPAFDVITARWVLHHISLKERWTHFVDCINRSKPGAMVFVVEHGFLQKPSLIFDKKLYWLLNATFDVVANIGIRPHWFTSTYPNIGANFFIHYLECKDFKDIKKGIKVQMTQNIYDVGPNFPNQTICCMRA